MDLREILEGTFLGLSYWTILGHFLRDSSRGYSRGSLRALESEHLDLSLILELETPEVKTHKAILLLLSFALCSPLIAKPHQLSCILGQGMSMSFPDLL